MKLRPNACLAAALAAAVCLASATADAYDIHTRALTPITEKPAPEGGPLRFVEGGELRFAIVTDDAKRDKKALDLLKEAFDKTVGRAPAVLAPSEATGLPLRLVLASDASLPPEGFSIKTSKDALTISSSTAC